MIALMECCAAAPGGLLVGTKTLYIVCTEHLLEAITDDLARSQP